MHGSRARGVYRLGRACVLDGKPRHRLKWLACALAATFAGRRRFERVYRSSITELAAAPLRRFQPSARR